MRDTRQRSGLDTALEVLRRQKWLVCLVTSGIFAAVLGVVMALPDIYQSTATILIEGQQLPRDLVKSTFTSQLDSQIQTMTQDILSDTQIESLIHRFDLYPDLRQSVPLPRLVSNMRQDISVGLQWGRRKQRRRGRNKAVTFTISYRGHDAKLLAPVTNALAALYIDENTKVRAKQATSTTQFLTTQIEDARSKLEQYEQSLSEFKNRHMGGLPQQLNANLATLERLNTQLQLNSNKLARASERRAILTRQLAEANALGPLSALSATTAYDSILNQINELTQELALLRTRYSDKYPNVIRLKSEIAALEQQLSASPRPRETAPNTPAPVNPLVQQLQAQVRAIDVEAKLLKVEEQRLHRDIVRYQQRVENAPRLEQELHALSRDYKAAQDQYDSLVKRQDEAKLAENMEQHRRGGVFRLLKPATPNQQPVAPNRRQLLLIGFVLAFGTAIGAVALRETLDTSLHTVDDLRAVSDIPVLHRLPHIETAAERRQKQWRFGLVTVSALLCLGLITGLTHIMAKGNAQIAKLLDF